MMHADKKSILLEKNPALRRKYILNFPRKDSAVFYKFMDSILKNESSPVIRHEVAFILGTVKTSRSLDLLMHIILKDESDLVRHEAIEAVGDIGIKSKKILILLNKLRKDPTPFIKDTAEVALATLGF